MESAESESSDVGSGYASYATGVLLLVYVFNFIDRQIISILAEEIKADLGISLDGDADRIIICDEKGRIIDGD